MSYQHEREEFIYRMTREGLPLQVTRLLLREATGLNRRAELACSSEAADRDRVACPAEKSNRAEDCCCDGHLPTHSADFAHVSVPRITVRDQQAERRVSKALPENWRMDLQGDPRGYVLRVIPPSYAERNIGRDRFNLETIGVPSGPSGLRF